MSNHLTHQPTRRGLSIMEVLFAIAVLTFGMLGVAHILPVATNNASMTLQKDRAVEEINNRIASDMAMVRDSFTEVLAASNSEIRAGARGRFSKIDVTQSHTSQLNRYDVSMPIGLNYQPRLLGAPHPTIPTLVEIPDAFCLDPWFLSAADPIRDDTTSIADDRNCYDRTVFPCYDPRYHPINVSPTAALSSTLDTSNNPPRKIYDGPRFARVSAVDGISDSVSAAAARHLTRRSDDFSVVIPEDRTRNPGLFIQRGRNGARSPNRNTVTSRYSSFLLMARSQPGSKLFNAAVVTMEDRHIVTVDNGDPIGGMTPTPTNPPIPFAHNLKPYTAWLPDDPANPSSLPTDQQLVFPGEMLGYVTYAPQPFQGGGGGEFIFQTNRYVKPDVSEGDWVMLMRREFQRDPVAGGPVAGPLKFAWYRVSDVVTGPAVVGGAYQTQLAVRGPDWTFHPIQVEFSPGSGVYGPPYTSPTPPTWATPPIFDYANMPAQGTDPAGYQHFDYGTFVVVMPDVVGVKQFQLQL